MRVAIVEAGLPPAGLVPVWGTYSGMIQRMLDMRDATVFQAFNGYLPDAGDAFVGVVVSGAASSANASDGWVAALLDLLQRMRGRTRLVGICFGHQIMARAFGGDVAPSRAWQVGRLRYRAVSREGGVRQEGGVALTAFHRDHVTRPPDDAQVVASHCSTPNAWLRYRDGTAMSLQAHPEFSLPFARALVRERADALGPTVTAEALRSLRMANDSAKVARVIASFVRGQELC